VLSLLVLFALVTPAAEVDRIQTHLEVVERELRARDTSALTREQRARRGAIIDELARYRLRRVFPRNLDHDRPTPYFVDDRGVRCAMAHLIETHGGAALVARVVATGNNAYVRDMAHDVELRAWLDANGLTVAEAARIQPSYPRGPGVRCGGPAFCTSGVCESALDEPRLSFCSIECDPDASTCPVGIEGIAMECQLRTDRYLCVYPEPTPGGLGWPCDPETSTVCEHACVASGDRGICAPGCANERACPTGFVCPAADGADSLRTCQPIAKDGCSATTPTTFLLGLLAVPLWRRRVRTRAAA
jgi:hypothetical protein